MKMLLNEKKETRIEIEPRVSANRPSKQLTPDKKTLL